MVELHPRFAGKRNWFWEKLIGENGIISGFKPVSGQQPPFGLLFLSAQLKKNGHEVSLLDGYFHTYDRMLSKIKTDNPQIVGIGSMSYNWHKTIQLAKMIKAISPEIKIVVGGKHPTVWGEKCFDESQDIDVVVTGEAEETIVELVENVDNGGVSKSIKGIIYKAINGEVINTGPRNPVADLDSLPFIDRDIIDVNQYRPTPFYYQQLPHTAIFASRGCPYTCTFCHSERKVRFRSAENVLDEIEFSVKKYGIKEISFYDETFTLKPEYADALCEGIFKKGLKISWSANARADKLEPDLLIKMKE